MLLEGQHPTSKPDRKSYAVLRKGQCGLENQVAGGLAQALMVSQMIRKAKYSDIPEIKILMRSEPGFWDDSWRDDVIDIGVESSKGLSFVWVENDTILGFVSAHDMGFRAYLSELIVSSEGRNIGIGRALIQEVEKALTQKGCKVLIADVWNDSLGFYRNLGYSEPDVNFLRKKL